MNRDKIQKIINEGVRKSIESNKIPKDFSDEKCTKDSREILREMDEKLISHFNLLIDKAQKVNEVNLKEITEAIIATYITFKHRHR